MFIPSTLENVDKARGDISEELSRIKEQSSKQIEMFEKALKDLEVIEEGLIAVGVTRKPVKKKVTKKKGKK